MTTYKNYTIKKIKKRKKKKKNTTIMMVKTVKLIITYYINNNKRVGLMITYKNCMIKKTVKMAKLPYYYNKEIGLAIWLELSLMEKMVKEVSSYKEDNL